MSEGNGLIQEENVHHFVAHLCHTVVHLRSTFLKELFQLLHRLKQPHHFTHHQQPNVVELPSEELVWSVLCLLLGIVLRYDLKYGLV